MDNLHGRISMLCDERKISKYRLCKDIGIQPSILTDLKSGRKKGLSAEVANKIAEYFGVSVGYLLGTEEKGQYDGVMLTRDLGHGESKTENSPATSIDEAGELTKQELSRISAAMAQMNEEGRERVVEYAEDLAAGGRYKKHGSDSMGEKQEEVV